MTSYERYLAYFLVFAYASGTLAHLWPAIVPLTRYTTDPLLLIVNSLLLWAIYRRQQDARLWSWLLFAYLLTFTLEALGVATGAVFGHYQYGPTMRWQALNVPFVIALNWAVLTLAANDLLGRWAPRWPGLATAAAAGVLLAAYDVVIEPVAIKLSYWQWEGGHIPLQNYLAWAL
ncbi:MAG: carotenoid biosynthesis protein, partial [Lewinella sp.]|nr:carotenoid biosynthesis protein [Lewinella sp.]